MKRILTWLIVAVVGILGWLVFKTLTAPKQKGIKRRASVPVAVEVSPVRQGTIRDRRLFIGSLSSPDMYMVSPKVSGRVRKINVNIGDRVKEGQLLAYLEDEEYLLQIQQAQAELAVAQARVEEQTSLLNLAQKEFQRVKELRDKKLVSQAELDSTDAKYRVESAKRKVVAAQVKHQQAQLRAAQVRLSYTRLRASSVTPRASSSTEPEIQNRSDSVTLQKQDKDAKPADTPTNPNDKKTGKKPSKKTKKGKPKKGANKPTPPTKRSATPPKKDSKAKVANSKAKVANSKAKAANDKANGKEKQPERVWMVAERYVNEGALIQANGPIVSVLDLRSLIAVIHVTEVEYPRLYVGQRAEIQSHIFRGKTFIGQIRRISPLLKDTSRHARVEISVPNPSLLLKPGMFMRVYLEFAKREKATLVPRVALVTRKQKQGVFVADPKNKTVQFVPVKVGIVAGKWAEIQEPKTVQGPVVTVGYHLLAEDSRILLPGDTKAPERKKSGRKGQKGRKNQPSKRE